MSDAFGGIILMLMALSLLAGSLYVLRSGVRWLTRRRRNAWFREQTNLTPAIPDTRDWSKSFMRDVKGWNTRDSGTWERPSILRRQAE